MIKKYNSKHKSYSKKKKREKLKKQLALYKDEDGKQKESSIERKVREILEKAGIYFVQEKYLQWKGKWKAFDFYITDGLSYNILVECDGYFHGLDRHGNKIQAYKLNSIQKKNIKNDKFKDDMATAFGIPLLRFKENEIKNQPEKIKKVILEEIERQKRINSVLG